MPFRRWGLLALCLAGLVGTSLLLSAFTLMPSAGEEGARWREFPIRFRVDYRGAPFERARIDMLLNKALQLWNGVGTSMLRSQLGEATQAEPLPALAGAVQDSVIVFDAEFERHFPDAGPATLAIGKAFHEGRSYRHGVIVINAAAAATSDPERLVTIVAHEAGHVFGIGHAAERSALMFPIVREAGRLSEDDVAAITFLYPRQEGIGALPLGCATIASASSGAHDTRRSEVAALVLGLVVVWKASRVLLRLRGGRV